MTLADAQERHTKALRAWIAARTPAERTSTLAALDQTRAEVRDAFDREAAS